MSKEFRQFVEEVRSRISAFADVPSQRKQFRAGYTFSRHEQEPFIWDFIWKNSECDRSMTQALFYAEKLRSDDLTMHSQMLRSWQDRVKNWWHCDGLAKILTRLLEADESIMLHELKSWNRSDDLWKRRQSVVALLYYSRTKKKVLPFERMIPLFESLISDPEYYVQKGVGWGLRELGNVYPTETAAFIEKKCIELSAIAFSTATEKYPVEKKSLLIDLRYRSRKKKK